MCSFSSASVVEKKRHSLYTTFHVVHAINEKANIIHLLIQSSLKTPLRALALIPGGSTQLIFGPSLIEEPLTRAKPWNEPLSRTENISITVVFS